MTDYIAELTTLLGQLTETERADVIDYYREYLLDAGIESYQGAQTELGAPRVLARQILADYSIQFNEVQAAQGSPRQTAKADVKMIWLIILALLSTPVTIPVLMLVIAAMILFLGFFLGLMLLILGLIVGAIVLAGSLVVVGLGVMMIAPWTGLFYMGIGLTLLSLLILSVPAIQWLTVSLIHGISRVSKAVYQRVKQRNRVERGQQQ